MMISHLAQRARGEGVAVGSSGTIPEIYSPEGCNSALSFGPDFREFFLGLVELNDFGRTRHEMAP
jgi:hypothetical protein